MSILSKVIGFISEPEEKSGRAAVFAVMSPPEERADEKKIVRELFELGLSEFHLRRTHWSAARVRGWLESFPPQLRSRIILHQFPLNVAKYGAGGFYLGRSENLPAPKAALGKVVALCDSFRAMLKAETVCDEIFLGPVFPPKKYDVTIPRRTLEEFAAGIAYRRTHGGKMSVPILAYGGISADNVASCRKAGFDGFVSVAAVWTADSPTKAFKKLLKKW